MPDDLSYRFIFMSDRKLIALLGGVSDPATLSTLQRMVLAEIERRCLDYDLNDALMQKSAAA